MRIVLQRVARASVSVGGQPVAEIGRGLLLLVASGKDERDGEIPRLAEKVANLRIFEDEAGKMNRSVTEAGGEFLVVPQFTLLGDARKGRRPSWDAAAPPEVAVRRIEAFAAALEALGARVARGAFGEHMQVELVNDGPVTLVLDGAHFWPVPPPG